MKKYLVEIEVAGPLAMFARPDTGSTPTSYPMPTWSACKGIFESIAMLNGGEAWIFPIRVEACKRRSAAGGTVRYQPYTTNYGGPLRKDSVIAKAANMQFIATVLTDVCYRIHAEVRGGHRSGKNPRHHLQEMFLRRRDRGQCHHTPALGWREFTCSYWGPPRDEYEIDTDLNLAIPSMLVTPWDADHNGRYASQFAHEVRVERGVLTFAE